MFAQQLYYENNFKFTFDKNNKMKKTFNLTFLIVIAFLSISCYTKSQSKIDLKSSSIISVISPSVFKENSINQTKIDVRTPQEFNEGHIEGALNINFYDEKFLEQIATHDKSKPIFVYCRSGKRSSLASKGLIKLGFIEVYDLQGGIINWENDNNQIAK